MRIVDFISEMLHWIRKAICPYTHYQPSSQMLPVFLYSIPSHRPLSLTVTPSIPTHPLLVFPHTSHPLSSILGEMVSHSFRRCDWSLAKCHRSSNCSTSSGSSASCLLASLFISEQHPFLIPCFYHLPSLLSCSSALSLSFFLAISRRQSGGKKT